MQSELWLRRFETLDENTGVTDTAYCAVFIQEIDGNLTRRRRTKQDNESDVADAADDLNAGERFRVLTFCSIINKVSTEMKRRSQVYKHVSTLSRRPTPARLMSIVMRRPQRMRRAGFPSRLMYQ